MAPFSRLKTNVSDPERLIGALTKLGIAHLRNGSVRGSDRDRERADVVAVLKGNCDIGWIRNADGTFDLIVDLWGVNQTQDVVSLIKKISAAYDQVEPPQNT